MFKAVLLVLVVVGHVFTVRVNQDPVKMWIYSFHMPLFLALSGYFFSGNKGVFQECGRALRRYLIPFLCATLVYFCYLYLVKGKAPFGLVESFLTPWYHLWFLPCLFVFSLLVCLLSGAPPSLVCLLFLLLAVSRHFGDDFRAYVKGFMGEIDARYFSMGMYFAFGYYCRTLLARYPSALWMLFWLPGLAIMAAHMPSPPWEWREPMRLCLAMGMLASIASFPAMPVLANNLFARESLGIYLYHPLPILMLRPFHEAMGAAWYWSVSLFFTLVCLPLACGYFHRFKGSSVLLGELPASSVR